jgi:hypothetical protein
MKKTGKNRKKTGLLHPSNSRMHKIGGSWHRPAGAKKETPPHLQNNWRKRAEGEAQAVKHLPNKGEALSSNPRITEKKILPFMTIWMLSDITGH